MNGPAENPVLESIKEKFLRKVVTGSRSPAGNWLSFTLQSIDSGKATLSLPVKPEMGNPYGNIHGGMMSLVIDEAIGWAVASLGARQHYTSLTLNVDFLFAARVGEQIRVVAEVLRTGKKIINVEAHVFDASDRILARANSNLIATNMEFQD